MRRREFIRLFAATIAWPLAAGAQQPDRMQRIGALMNVPADTQWGQAYIALSKLGWSDGGNLRIDVRWGENDIKRDRKYGTELVGLAPELVLSSGTLSAAACRPQLANRVRAGLRSGRSRLRRQLGQAGQERYRLHDF